jgi:hypothetical protein
MKNNKTVKFMALVLFVTILAIILVSGTYAKYTTSATGSDTATVAKWSIKLGNEDIAKSTEKTFTIDLFSTITNTDGSEEKNVKKTDGTLIAPGTMGSFTLASLKNESEVNAKYSVTYTLSNESGVPLEFTTNKDDESSWKSDFTAVNVSNEALATDATATTATIYWRWAFTKDTARDTSDTTLGTTTPTVTLTAKIDVEQAD